MPLNHADRGAHLHSKRVYIHPIVEQGKGRVGVTYRLYSVRWYLSARPTCMELDDYDLFCDMLDNGECLI